MRLGDILTVLRLMIPRAVVRIAITFEVLACRPYDTPKPNWGDLCSTGNKAKNCLQLPLKKGQFLLLHHAPIHNKATLLLVAVLTLADTASTLLNNLICAGVWRHFRRGRAGRVPRLFRSWFAALHRAMPSLVDTRRLGPANCV